MIGTTLSRYLAANFLRNVALVFGLFLGLIIAVDLIELSRDLNDENEATFLDALIIVITRAPLFAANVLPFATLFAATASLLLLSRKLELVVARAAGVSAWQFLSPMLIAAFVLGLFSATIYNPLALEGQRFSRGLEASAFGEIKGSFSNKTSIFWQRLNAPEGDSILSARVVEDAGAQLTGVTAYRFNQAGVATVRLDAASATFETRPEGNNVYVLRNVVQSGPGQTGEALDRVEVPLILSREDLQARTRRAEDISFWELDEVAERAIQSGKNALPYQTQKVALLSQSLLFAAMVLIAATMSLSMARFGVNWRSIAAGICAGFVLYVLVRLVLTFGSNGLVPPWFAAWTPALVATLIASTVILHREDG